MALVSLLPYIDNKSSEPWSPLRSTLDMANYIEQISAVFENPSIQQIPGGDSKAIWDTRTTFDFPNNVIDEEELYPRKKRKLPRSIKSLDPDSPSTDKLFEGYHKDIWTAAPSGLRRQGRDLWKSRPSPQRQQSEDLKGVGQVSREASDAPSLTDADSTSRPSLIVETPTSVALDTLNPHILISGYRESENLESVEHLDWWMETLQTGPGLDSSVELEPPQISTQVPMIREPTLGPPRRSSTMPVPGTERKPRKVRQHYKRDSWPAPVVALKRPAFPRKKIQELQTTTTREEFTKSLTVAEEEKQAKSKRMLSLLLPLVKPKEAIQFFPLFTKREIKLLTELLEEDSKLAAKLEKVGISLPLNREEILQMAVARNQDDDDDSSSNSSEGGASSKLSIEAVSIASSRIESPAARKEQLEEFPPEQELDKEISKRQETTSHLLPNSKASERDWKQIVKKLDPRFRYIMWCQGVWTLELESFNTVDVPSIPLYIANSPVILSYAKPTPQISGQRPPDPLRDRPLPVGTLVNLSNEILKILFRTFPKAAMVCMFLNQRMSVVYDHDFDEGIEHMTKPETFGGYRVSFMKNRPAFTAAQSSSYKDRLLTGKRVDVCRPDSDNPWTSCVGVRLRRKKPSLDPNEPNDAITMTTHAFLTALRLPNTQDTRGEDDIEYHGSNSSLSSVVTHDDFARMKVYDRMNTKKGEFGQYYQSYDDLHRLRGDVRTSKFMHDLCLIKSAENAPQELPIISFQKKKKNQFKKLEWCTSADMLKDKKGKMYLLNSWTGADSKNPKAGNVVAEGLMIGEAYQNIPQGQKDMYSRSILWRQNFTSKQWQVGQVQGLRERAYRVWNGAPVRRIRLEQHLTIQEQGYSGSPLAVKVNNSVGEESYAIFGFQNYAMRCWRPDEDDGFRKAAFGNKKNGSVVNRVLMEALDHGAYEFFGAYKLPEKVIQDWDIVYDVEEVVPGVTQVGETLVAQHKLEDQDSMEIDTDNSQETSRTREIDYIQRSSRSRSTFRRRVRRSSSSVSAKCIIM